MGTVYLRGKTYWILYFRNGRKYSESTKSKLKMVANNLLKQREGDRSRGKLPGALLEKVKLQETDPTQGQLHAPHPHARGSGPGCGQTGGWRNEK